MRVLTVGGGSGGHVTPVKAVIEELYRHSDAVEVRFICDRAFKAQADGIFASLPVAVPVSVIATGKLRRYHGVSVVRQLLDIETVARNVIDLAKVVAGTVQSVWYLLRWRPDVIFTKGGFVCLPVGVAARLLRVPLVIHDSDAHPGLTNRVLARWARVIATGSPTGHYPYPKDKMVYTGIPVSAGLVPPTPEQQRHYKMQLGMIDVTRPLVVVTGGGLGARRINQALFAIADTLIAAGYSIYHVTGKKLHGEAKGAPESVHYQSVGFSTEMPMVLGAADVVITRAGATTLQELAALAKPTVIVPNPLLTGGHQLKNAAVYAEADAALVVDEAAMAEHPAVLAKAIAEAVRPKRRAELSEHIHTFAMPDAALDVANKIVDIALNRERTKKLASKKGRVGS